MYRQLAFDELAKLLQEFGGRKIGARITNNTRRYAFTGLKPSASFNPDLCGLSLHHHGQPQECRRSRFHDEEDVAITFWRDEFQEASIHDDKVADRVWVHCKNFSCEVTILKN